MSGIISTLAKDDAAQVLIGTFVLAVALVTLVLVCKVVRLLTMGF